MDPISAAIIGGAMIVGTVASTVSAHKANKENINLQKETNETSIELANTAHQREVADLKAAGLNPVLSAGGGGAMTPTLGTAQVQSTTPNMAENMVAVANAMSNAKNAQSNSAVASADADLKNAQTINTMTDTQYMPAMKKAEIAAQYANAGSAKATADYTKMMTQVDQEIKDAQTQELLAKKDLHEAETKRNENLTKGEQSREWVRAISGGILNIAGAAHSGRMAAQNMTPIHNHYYY